MMAHRRTPTRRDGQVSSRSRLRRDRAGRLISSTQVRYLVVGAWNTLFGLVLFIVLLALLDDDLGYGVILLICQVIAVLQAHSAQRRLVWRSTRSFWPELARFSAVYVVSYVVNLALLTICVEIVGWPVLESQVGLTFVIVAGTYTLNRYWTFRHAGTHEGPASSAVR